MKFLCIAADHAGFELKQQLIKDLSDYDIVDLGSYDNSSVDYPDYANQVAQYLRAHPDRYGVLICGSGIGMSISVNRHLHIRAALCRTIEDATLARAHNDANVIIIGARVTDLDTSKRLIDVFCATHFEGGRHAKRVNKLGEVQDA